MDNIENGNFSHRRILFWEFINTQDTWEGRWCYNMFRKSFFFFLYIISKLRHAEHANVSSFSEHLCNHTLEVKIVPVLAWKFIPYSEVLCFLHIKKWVYLFFVASLSCHCGSLKMYKKSLLKESFTLKLKLCHFLIRSKTILLISHNLFWSYFPAMILIINSLKRSDSKESFVH